MWQNHGLPESHAQRELAQARREHAERWAQAANEAPAGSERASTSSERTVAPGRRHDAIPKSLRAPRHIELERPRFAAAEASRGPEGGWAHETLELARDHIVRRVNFATFLRKLQSLAVTERVTTPKRRWLDAQVRTLRQYSEHTSLPHIHELMSEASRAGYFGTPEPEYLDPADERVQRERYTWACAEKEHATACLAAGLAPRAYLDVRLSELEDLQRLRDTTPAGIPQHADYAARFNFIHSSLGNMLKDITNPSYENIFYYLNRDVFVQDQKIHGPKHFLMPQSAREPGAAYGSEQAYHAPVYDGLPLHLVQPSYDGVNCGYYAMAATLHALARPAVTRSEFLTARATTRDTHFGDQAHAIHEQELTGADDLVNILRAYASTPGRRLTVQSVTMPREVLFAPEAGVGAAPEWLTRGLKAVRDARALLILHGGHWTALICNHGDQWVHIDSKNADSQTITYTANGAFDAAQQHFRRGIDNLIAIS